MLSLPNISLIAITSGEEQECIQALDYSSREIVFGKRILFTDDVSVKFSGKVVKTRKFSSIGDWGHFVVFELWQYIDTDYVLLVHPDGFVVNSKSWNPKFLDYDYVGAPWPIPSDKTSFRDHYGNIIRVGNSVSLRSKKLLQLPSIIGLTWNDFDGGFPHEDGFICVQHRHTLVERYQIKFPPLSIAVEFGRENEISEYAHEHPFTFHKWKGKNAHFPNFDRRKYYRKRLKKALKKAFNVAW